MEGRKDGYTQGTIEKQLSKVVAPKTGLDVLRMGVVRDLRVDRGEVSLVFRPTEALRALAFQLGTAIRDVVQSVAGVRCVRVRVENFDRAAELERLLETAGRRRRQD